MFANGSENAGGIPGCVSDGGGAESVIDFSPFLLFRKKSGRGKKRKKKRRTLKVHSQIQ